MEITSDILGRWRIVEIEGQDPKNARSEFQAFVELEHDGGEFHFGNVQGFIDHRLVERDGRPGAEWTWDGTDEMDDVSGRGWAVLHKDHLLKGVFFIHQGDEISFAAKKVGARRSKPSAKSAATKATARQGQFLAFIFHYTKLNGHAPAEADMQRHFGISPPSVHQMVLTLERRGFIARTPGMARSIRLLIPREQLPDLE